jgi:hypothetical protein
MFLFGCLLHLTCLAQSRVWQARVATGTVYNLPTHLSIRQAHEAAITLKAKYRTEPFRSPFYYDFFLSAIKANRGVGVKFTHHKLILESTHNDIQLFSITDGFNLLTVNRLFSRQGFTWSFGGGIVITHPESTIRQQTFPENKGILKSGYFISGPAIEAAVSKQLYLTKHLYLSVEGRTSGSYVRVPVADGYANVSNVAFHLLGGIGYQVFNK